MHLLLGFLAMPAAVSVTGRGMRPAACLNATSYPIAVATCSVGPWQWPHHRQTGDPLSTRPFRQPAFDRIASVRSRRVFTQIAGNERLDLAKASNVMTIAAADVLDGRAPLGRGPLDLSRLAPEPQNEHVRVLPDFNHTGDVTCPMVGPPINCRLLSPGHAGLRPRSTAAC